METITYSVKATPKDGSKPYIIHDNKQYTDKDIAESECNACNQYWGDRITFTVIENK